MVSERRWRRLRGWGPPVALVVLAIALWELLVRALDVPGYLVPARLRGCLDTRDRLGRARLERLGHAPRGPRRLFDRRRGRGCDRRSPSPLAGAQACSLPDPDRVAEHSDRRARADPRHPARLRHRPEAGDRRPLLLLPDRRQRRRRPGLDRPRVRPDDAHAVRLALVDLPTRRVSLGAARSSSRARASRRPTPPSARSSASGRGRIQGSATSSRRRPTTSVRLTSCSPPSCSSR